MEAFDSLVHCASLPSAAQHMMTLIVVVIMLMTQEMAMTICKSWEHIDHNFVPRSSNTTMAKKSSGTLSTKLTFSSFRVYVLSPPSPSPNGGHHHHYHHLPTFIFAKISPVPQGLQEDLAHYKRVAFLFSRFRAVPSDGAGLSCGFVDSPAK